MPLTCREVVQTASLGAVLASLLKATPAVSAPSAGQGTKIVNLDDRVTLKQQLEHNVGPVVLMSTFLVPPDQVDNFLEGFKKQFAIMRKQPGLISAQLHRGILSSVQATQRRGERALRQSEDVDALRRCEAIPDQPGYRVKAA